jgi:hypothetical protein
MDICKQVEPDLDPSASDADHFTRCHLDQDVKDREAAKLAAGVLAEAS